MPMALSLYRDPLCQTLSNAFVISKKKKKKKKKTTGTSLPLSTASQHISYTCSSFR